MVTLDHLAQPSRACLSWTAVWSLITAIGSIGVGVLIDHLIDFKSFKAASLTLQLSTTNFAAIGVGLGIWAFWRIKRSNGRLKGSGFALAGIVTGTLLSVVYLWGLWVESRQW
jgi:hypothetical protein